MLWQLAAHLQWDETGTCMHMKVLDGRARVDQLAEHGNHLTLQFGDLLVVALLGIHVQDLV